MDDVKAFLESQKLLVLSTVDEQGNPWTCNVYYSVDNKLNIFFVSPVSTKHIQHIKHNQRVSFSVPWFNPDDLTDRKAIQGAGVCEQVTSPKTIISLIKNHSKYYPLWKEVLTYENIKSSTIESRPFIIKPDYLKYWDDKLYGSEGTKEFKL